jgi:hypothetical protein
MSSGGQRRPSPDHVWTQQVQRLKQRVSTLEAIEQIRSLRYRYHEYVNENRWHKIGSLFTPHAHIDYAHLGRASGQCAIQKFFADVPRALEQDEGATTTVVRQFVHAHDVQVSGDRGTGTCFLEATPVYHQRSFIVSGEFSDEYARRDGVWLFERISLELYWMVPLEEGWAGRHNIQMTL